MAYTVFRRSLPAMGLLTTLLFQSAVVHAQAQAQAADDNEVLTRTITDLDAKVFDAYNRCDMESFSRYFIPDVEFYHDNGGVSRDRDTVVANTRKYICHKVRRELLPDTLKIYPVKNYGAIEEGEHRFCQIDTGKCEGIARFLMIWQHKDDQWQMTRVISYGHRVSSAAADKIAAVSSGKN